MGLPLVRKGKVKEVYDAGAELEFRFTDQISVFDKVIPSLIPHKGETLCRTSAHWFERTAAKGIPTHFLRVTDPTTMRVRKVEVDPDVAKRGASATNVMVPLEVIVRYYVAGSFLDRIESGVIDPKALGLRGPAALGTELPDPYFEVTTKLEPTDRLLDETEARAISGLSRQEFGALRETALRIDDVINDSVRSRGLVHVDGKKEFALDGRRQLMVIDTFGTADEDRFWDKARFDAGELVDLSKEFVRGHYRASGYHRQLYAARERGEKEPPIPPLPPDLLAQTSSLYISLFERLTGQPFR